MKATWIVVPFFLGLGACAGKHTSVANQSIEQNEPTGPVFRHLAWQDGNLQTDYAPDRQIAETKLKQWEGKVPDLSDSDDYLNYLSVLSATGRPDAEKRVKEFLGKYPNEKRAVYLLAVNYLRNNKKEMAQYLFNSLEKDASFAWRSLLLNNLGLLALGEKNNGLALDYLEKAVKASPPIAAPYVNLGALYLKSKSYADAERMFKKAANLDESFEDAALGWGSALEGQGKFAEAHRVYSDFMDNNPGALSVLYNDSLILGNRLQQREAAAQQMLRYVQRGGKETARAHEQIQNWR